ncbi:hypothetical protein GCM10023194_81530 [Planotetraspora phitsanulokensis]|uniref:Uncharacterized protein n=2 Tax=Planotetraspora phitsanulokensis TaxID=575192 RepID=A0A8J3UCW6_9ACTN|nr:hypothetical protein Pph01_79110 [Planotetraspora phitsanulokensis]
MYGLYHRTFIAFHAGDPRECRIVEAETPADLWDGMQQAAAEVWRTSHLLPSRAHPSSGTREVRQFDPAPTRPMEVVT